MTDENLVYITDEAGVRSYEQMTGAPVGQSARGAGAKGGVALDDPRVYAGPGCNVSLFTKGLGEPAWTYGTSCGEGNFPPAVYGGKVWARSVSGGGVVLDQTLGLKTDNFNSHGGLAFAGDLGYFRNPTQIQARRVDSGTIAWTYTPKPDVNGSSTPSMGGSVLVVRGVVYGLTAEGRLVGLDRTNGAELWTTELGSSVRGSSSSSSELASIHGMAADESGLVVPTGSRITALGPGDSAPGVDDPDKEPGAQTKLTAGASTKSVDYPGKLTISGEVTRSGSSYGGQDDLELQAATYPCRVVVDRGAAEGQLRPLLVRAAARPQHPLPGGGHRHRARRRLEDDAGHPLPRREPAVHVRGCDAAACIGEPACAAWLQVDKRPIYIYLYTSRRDRTGTRIGRLELKRTGTGRYRARGTLRTRRLRNSDLFYTCVPLRAWREIGNFTSKDRCGARRL